MIAAYIGYSYYDKDNSFAFVNGKRYAIEVKPRHVIMQPRGPQVVTVTEFGSGKTIELDYESVMRVNTDWKKVMV